MLGTIWFVIVAAMLAAYVVLDGFDIGAGALHLLVAKSERERQTVIASIGPVWDGNEVWLLAAGGTLYFAFPVLYASAFSGFYLPLMIVLWLLIMRGLGIELRSHFDMRLWHEFFDACFAISSALLAIFFGAALANVIRGVPIQTDGYFFLPMWTNWLVGPNPGILDWYTVLGGFLALIALCIHGALYLAMKTEADIQLRSRKVASLLMPVLMVLSAVSLLATMIVRPSTLTNYKQFPIAFLIPAFVIGSLTAMFVFSRCKKDKQAFLSSCAYISMMLVGAAVGLYPTLLPSSSDATRDITVANALSGHYSASVGLIWWGFGILLAVGYFIFVYSMFSGKVKLTPDGHGH